mgnify:CR=1 FL=1
MAVRRDEVERSASDSADPWAAYWAALLALALLVSPFPYDLWRTLGGS